MQLFAIRSQVVVFPHHFGPSRTTAPADPILSERISSIILCLYLLITAEIITYHGVQRNRHSAVWTIFIRQFGRFSFGSLDGLLLTHFQSPPENSRAELCRIEVEAPVRRPLGAANPPCQSTTPQMKPIQIRSGSLLGPLTPTHGRKRHNARTPCKICLPQGLSPNFSRSGQ